MMDKILCFLGAHKLVEQPVPEYVGNGRWFGGIARIESREKCERCGEVFDSHGPSADNDFD